MATNIFTKTQGMGTGRSRLKNLVDNRDQSGRSSLSRYSGPDARPPNQNTGNTNKSTTTQPSSVSTYATTAAANVGGGGGGSAPGETLGNNAAAQVDNSDPAGDRMRGAYPNWDNMTPEQKHQAWGNTPFGVADFAPDPYANPVVSDPIVNTGQQYQDNTPAPAPTVSAMGNPIGYGDTDWAAHQARRDAANGVVAPTTPVPPQRDMAAEQAQAREYWASVRAERRNGQGGRHGGTVEASTPLEVGPGDVESPPQTGADESGSVRDKPGVEYDANGNPFIGYLPDGSPNYVAEPTKSTGSGPVMYNGPGSNAGANNGQEWLFQKLSQEQMGLRPPRPYYPGKGDEIHPYPRPVDPYPRFSS